MGLIGRLLGGEASEKMAVGSGSNPVAIVAYATVVVLPPMDFPHAIRGVHDIHGPDLWTHMKGFIGYLMQLGDGQMTQGRYHAWRHLQRVKHSVSLQVDVEHLPKFQRWATAANAILFMPDDSIRSPNMDVLFSAEQQSRTAEGLPFPADAIDRRLRSMASLIDGGLKAPASMPPSLGEAELLLQRPEEVFNRALALLFVDAVAWAHGSGKPPAPAGTVEGNPYGYENLTEMEKAFVADPDDDRASALMWRHEAANVLLWAIGVEGADVSDAGKQIYATTLWNAVLRTNSRTNPKPSFRSTSEILDLTDLVWRQHWNVRDAALKGEEIKGIDADVIEERHHALNWLTCLHNDLGTSWDNIDTPS